jgi:hypothetical protein
MPPNQSRSASDFRIARISSIGVVVLPLRPNRLAISADTGIDFSARENTPPPLEISLAS